jgi:hypothetical protein
MILDPHLVEVKGLVIRGVACSKLYHFSRKVFISEFGMGVLVNLLYIDWILKIKAKRNNVINVN